MTDPCDKWGEISCNRWISANQERRKKAAAFTVTGFQSSEYRGLELANHVENFMATTGHKKVNFIGHSQGGLDIRKAAHELRYRSINGVASGKKKVASMISIGSPHRGTETAKGSMDKVSPTCMVAMVSC